MIEDSSMIDNVVMPLHNHQTGSMLTHNHQTGSNESGFTPRLPLLNTHQFTYRPTRCEQLLTNLREVITLL